MADRRRATELLAPRFVELGALLGLLSPLVAALLGAVVGGESLTPTQLIGFAVALTALVLGQLPSPAPREDMS